MQHEVISIVICYHNSGEVCHYADSLLQLDGGNDIALVVVINKATGMDIGALQSLAERSALDVMITDPGENLGYMNGLLFGYRQYRAAGGAVPRYVILSNTDIQYADSGFLQELLGRKYQDGVWCIGPSIYVPGRKTYDNPSAGQRRTKREIDRLIHRFETPFLRVLYIGFSPVKGRLVRGKKPDSQLVYEVHGCFFILTGECADYMAEKRFGALMYSEEAFVAENIYQTGHQVFYDADLEVWHMEHSVTGLLSNRKIAEYLAESMRWIRDEFYGDI